MSAVLEARELSKAFGSGPRAVHALDGFSLTVPEGGVFGLLGPNGAGKSTLFRIALDLVRPSRGQILLLGSPVGADLTLSRAVGAMIETPRYPPFLTALEVLECLARASGLRPARPELIGRLERMGLADAAHRRAHNFSVGMKQRLGVAAALLTSPRLLILDEPTSGMDPAGIQEMRRLIRELADKDGVTVLLASHLLDEVQRVCDRVAIIDHGRLAAEGRVEELVAAEQTLRLTVSAPQKALALLGERGSAADGAVLARIPREDAPELIRALVEARAEVFEARWIGGDLERLFLQRTGEADAD